MLEANELLVTECVALKHRGRGYGRAILNYLIRIAAKENRNLIAELWSTNASSIALHEHTGFKFVSAQLKDGNEMRRYLLTLNAVEAMPTVLVERSKVVAQG
jgi:L-amino acid N-acyltransferase YncA